MPKKKDTLKQLRYDRRKDPNTNCYLDANGCYVFTRDVKVAGHWEKEEVLRFNPDDYPNGTEIILALTECDRDEDEQEETLNEHIDKVFQKRLGRYENAADDTQLVDPWEEVAYEHGGDDLFDQIFPETMPVGERMEKLEAFISTLQPQQVDLVYQHLGARRTLEELRLEEQERTGKPVSQQAFSDRWNKILTRACKFFGVPKPRKRRTKDE